MNATRGDGTATDRASELGTAHGKAAAEAWLYETNGWQLKIAIATLDREWPFEDGGTSTLPVPDRSGAPHAYGSYPDIRSDLDVTDEEIDAAGGLDPWCDAYEAAFTEAVETTVREAVQ